MPLGSAEVSGGSVAVGLAVVVFFELLPAAEATLSGFCMCSRRRSVWLLREQRGGVDEAEKIGIETK